MRFADNTKTMPNSDRTLAKLFYMSRVLVATSLLLARASATGEAKDSQRTIQCKTQTVAVSCYWTRGRLAVANGNPSYRLWRIGTDRLFGIYSGPNVFDHQSESKYALDNEAPELPSNVEDALWRSVKGAWLNVVYADFEVCPLNQKPEAMQAVCIESAKNITIKNDH